MTNFNSIEWINRFSSRSNGLQYSDLEPVLSFSLMWNLFEKVTCDNNANLNKIEEDINSSFENNLLNADDFSESLDFFRNRYLVDRDIANLPRNLRLRGNRYITIVKGVLTGELNDINNVVFALFIIAYRVRNNMFHGEKNIYTIDSQLELFNSVNSLIAKYLEITRSEFRS